MKTTKKALLLALCAVLLVVSTVFATLAYLTSTTDVVTNTFTVGDIVITLDETDVDVYGVKDGDTRVLKNTYKLIPGHEYTKDPTIHVKAGSEVCYLFVKVTDEIVDIQDAKVATPNEEAVKTVATQMSEIGWKKLDGVADVYYFNGTIDARNATEDIDVPVFTYFTIKGDAKVADYDGETITVQAYAVQLDGFDTAADAWAATFGAPVNP